MSDLQIDFRNVSESVNLYLGSIENFSTGVVNSSFV
jgi:hypothetical protein